MLAGVRVGRTMWSVLLLVGLLLGLRAVWGVAKDIQGPDIYRKDFVQEYMLARAVLERVDPYTSRGELSTLFGLPDVSSGWPTESTSTPHPPPVALLFLPFGLLNYPTAVAVWLAMEMGMLGAITLMLVGTVGIRASPLVVLIAAMGLTLPRPFRADLDLGQLMVFILLLIVAARLAILSNRALLGGVLLGLTISVKFFAWPLLLMFVLRRDWRVVIACALTSISMYCVAALAMGPAVVVEYFTRVLPADSDAYHYTSNLANLSTWTIGARLFEGVSLPTGQVGTATSPLTYAPLVGTALSILVPFMVLIFGTMYACKRQTFDEALGIMLCVSVLVSPVAWIYYFVLALIPLAQLVTPLGQRSVISAQGALVATCAVLLSIPNAWWTQLAHVLAGESWLPGETWTTLPFAPALVTLVPTLALGGLCCMLVASGTRSRGRAIRLARSPLVLARVATGWE